MREPKFYPHKYSVEQQLRALSEAEIKVLYWIVHKLSDTQIAKKYNYSVKWVNLQSSKLYERYYLEGTGKEKRKRLQVYFEIPVKKYIKEEDLDNWVQTSPPGFDIFLSDLHHLYDQLMEQYEDEIELEEDIKNHPERYTGPAPWEDGYVEPDDDNLSGPQQLTLL